MEWNFELVAGPYAGPLDAAAWDGSGLLFSVQSERRILRFDPETRAVGEFRRFMSSIKALSFDSAGSLYAAQSASRRIIRFNADGSATPLEQRIDGHLQNYPNDLVIDRAGRMWFSDPDDPPVPQHGAQLQGPLDDSSVRRLEPTRESGWRIVRMTFDTTNPRGIALSADERTLFVADGQELRAYSVDEAGCLGPSTVIHNFAPHRGVDGMCLDHAGNIVAGAGSAESGPWPLIYMFAPAGRVLATHPFPETPLSCAFGDAESLYVTTAEGSLYRARNTGHRGR
jgi:gluconolactonase